MCCCNRGGNVGLHEAKPSRKLRDTTLLAHVGAEEVKAVLDVRDPCLLVRESQASLRQKLCDQGLHLMLQELLGMACDDEVIREPDHMDFRPCVALEGRKGLFDVPL